MFRQKLIGRLAGLLSAWLAVAPATGANTPLPEPTVPQISQRHRAFLSELVRRTLREAVLGRPAYQPRYVPDALVQPEAEVIVRLREGGYLRYAGTGGPAPLVEATQFATLSASDALIAQHPDPVDALAALSQLLIEIEVAGPTQPLNVQVDWTAPGALDRWIEPGVHGLTLWQGRERRNVCPTELFTSDKVLHQAARALAQQLANNPRDLTGIRLGRFRTVHWYTPAGSDEVVSLRRGLVIVPPDAVTRASLEDTIDRLGDYLMYRQQKDGHFAYQYEPALDVYTSDDNEVRQAGATAALAAYAAYTGRAAVAECATRSLRYHLQRRREFPGVPGAAFIATPDGENKLGVTALVCLALTIHPQAEQWTKERQALMAGMLALQQESGMFLTAFPPAVRVTAQGQDYFPGEALLALAAAYEREPRADILQAFDRALGFYAKYFEQSPSPAFVPWQVQAYARMARHTKRADYRRYVFQLTDWLADHQLNRTSCEWPELWGGIAAYQEGRVGVATAAYLEGFAAALELARAVDDQARVARYEEVVRSAARFVIQLQVREEEAYYIRSPQDAVGGIRTAPALNLLRVDHVQHALIGLMGTREVLHP